MPQKHIMSFVKDDKNINLQRNKDDFESEIYSITAKPILNKIEQLLNNDSLEDNHETYLHLLDSLSSHYKNKAVVDERERLRLAFESIITLPFHCNNEALYDFDPDLLEELAYCIKSQKKEGKGYFENFKQFERFLGVKEGSLHQIVFDRTYNFKKANVNTFYKLIKFLELYNDVEELNQDLLTAKKLWREQHPKTIDEQSKVRENIFNIIYKSQYLNDLSTIRGSIRIHKNQYVYFTMPQFKVSTITQLTKKTKTPLLLQLIHIA